MIIDLHYDLKHKLLANTFNGNVITMLLNITDYIMEVTLRKDTTTFENFGIEFYYFAILLTSNLHCITTSQMKLWNISWLLIRQSQF